MEKIGIFFGPLNGSVHRIAKLVASKIGDEKVDLIHIASATAADLEKYTKIIFGISTIGKDTWQQKFDNTDWSHFFPVVTAFDFTGKRVAIFGLGDHITYAYHFVDSMGLLGKAIRNQGGEIFGKVSTDGYTFQDSEAIVEGKFIGLPVDEDFESELTEERVSAWVESLMKEL
ncbi:MAG TPA: flavodoxin [Prolixibacteraceae bacterium]|jgi:flavodoxin I|nr:flavodoxin [Prolixibacteraceae bacterium]